MVKEKMKYEEETWVRTFTPRVQGNFVSWAKDDLILLTLGYAYKLGLKAVPNQATMDYAILSRGGSEDRDHLIIDTNYSNLEPKKSYERRIKLSHPVGRIPKDITQILQREGFTYVRTAA